MNLDASNHTPASGDMRAQSAQRTIIFLGLLSALPFIGLCIHTYVWPEYRNYGVRALIAYAALVLSFIGALHCGLALGRIALGQAPKRLRLTFTLVWSLLPSLLAWCSLLLMPQAARYWLMLGFLLSLWVDFALLRPMPVLHWYLRLRLGLTPLVLIALALARMAPAAA